MSEDRAGTSSPHNRTPQPHVKGGRGDLAGATGMTKITMSAGRLPLVLIKILESLDEG